MVKCLALIGASNEDLMMVKCLELYLVICLVSHLGLMLEHKQAPYMDTLMVLMIEILWAYLLMIHWDILMVKCLATIKESN